MKKTSPILFIIVLLVMSTSIFSGCSSKSTITAQAVNVNYEHNYVEARVGDVICSQINSFLVTPSEVNLKCVFSSSNPSVASVNVLTGEVTCLKVGTVTIYGHVKKADGSMVSDSFTLFIREKLFFATGFTLQNETKVMLGLYDLNVANPINYEGVNVNVFPIISYDNSEIASYNYETGLITPKSVGTTTVFVTLQLKNEAITKQFIVEVVEKLLYIDIETTFEIDKNKLQYINFQIIDNTQPTGFATGQKVYLEVLVNAHLIDIVQNDFQAILISTKSEAGTVLIKLTYINNTSITQIIGITIK